MKHRKHLSPELNIVRLALGKTLSLAMQLGEFSTWLLTGVAAILGAVIVNVDKVSTILSATSLHYGLGLLIISLLAGVVVKQLGFAICAGLDIAEEMYDALETPEGEKAIQHIRMDTEAFKQQFSSAFLPPIRGMMRRSFDRGTQDALSAERRLAKVFCVQLYSFWLQGALGTAGLLVLGLGIK